MKGFIPVLLACSSAVGLASANEIDRARALEKEGDGANARTVLLRAAEGASAEPAAVIALAEFLDRHRDPGARAVYEKALKQLQGERARSVARRLITLDLLANDRESALRHIEAYRSSGVSDIDTSRLQAAQRREQSQPTIKIPGPLRSFARMAALSPELQPMDLLSALARNVVTNGYQASASAESLEQTEYLKLVHRYLSQAREIEKIAMANNGTVVIEACDSGQTADLLRVLGYRMRGACGSDVVLETVNATRAFLTIDSGFPLAELEQALRTSRPFRYEFRPTEVPVLYGPEFWLKGNGAQGEFIDTFLADPQMCRLYLGLSKLDPETAEGLKTAIPLPRLKAFAHVLDFYGGMFEIKNGVAIVPGGERTWPAWSKLTGREPKDGGAFFERLLTRDDGWLASLYDALARIDGPTRDYLLDMSRLDRFYSGLRGRVTSPGPARPVFRASTDLMLLTQRLRLEPDGKPHVPGGIEVWKQLFVNHPHGKYDGKLTKSARNWKDADDVLEALFALCRKSVENEPLKIFMALSDLNRFRAKPLESATVDRLARAYRDFGSQYAVFSEAPSLADATIIRYLDVAEAVSEVGDQRLRADTAGTLQALISLWQIFVRQGSIKGESADSSLSTILESFSKLRSDRELFDAGRGGVKTLLTAAGVASDGSPQDHMIDLLAGTGDHPNADAQRQVVEGLIRIVEAQRLASLDIIFQLADNLEAVAKGERLNTSLVSRLASRISEIQLPRASLSTIEKNSMAFGYWIEKHIDAQRKTNLRSAIEKAANNPERLREIRGLLAPFLRDTLVGLNYAHYAPPGAQILYTNPLFVRSHDFLGLQGTRQTWKQTEVFGTGWPSSAGGRLVGSLAGLPYALAEAEQNFLIPSREQALIWGDLVPQMILMAKVPRWWSVSPAQLQWVSLHLSQGESLLADAALNAECKNEVLRYLSRHAPPVRVAKVSELIDRGEIADAVETVTPAELYMIAADWWAVHKDENTVLAAEIRRIAKDEPQQVTAAAISRTFGTPKPTLTNSYTPELLPIRTFPTLMGYSSRIMAESWQSNLLYYAALADEVHRPPSELNVLVPEWTQRTVETIFATHLEDWPALLRSLRAVGENVRAKARKQMEAEQKASLQ
jgi:hypothetical protein